MIKKPTTVDSLYPSSATQPTTLKSIPTAGVPDVGASTAKTTTLKSAPSLGVSGFATTTAKPTIVRTSPTAGVPEFAASATQPTTLKSTPTAGVPEFTQAAAETGTIKSSPTTGVSEFTQAAAETGVLKTSPDNAESNYNAAETQSVRLILSPDETANTANAATATATETVSSGGGGGTVSYYAVGAEGLQLLEQKGRIFAGANINLTIEEQQYISQYKTITGANVGGTNTQVQFNFNGEFAGSPGLTFSTLNNDLEVSGNVVAGEFFVGDGSLLTGISSLGNFISSGNSYANVIAPNSNVVIGADGETWIFDTTGNLTAPGTISTAEQVIASGVIQSGTGLSTGGYLSVNGATDLHDTTVTGNLSVTGNITGNITLTNVMQDRGSDSSNWNAITQMGTYTVNRTSWAGTSGTPLDSQVFVGLLEVLNSTSTAISQVFYPGTVDIANAKIQWSRSYWAGVWTPWIKILDGDQTLSGGEF